jgi:hypothetical protein
MEPWLSPPSTFTRLVIILPPRMLEEEAGRSVASTDIPVVHPGRMSDKGSCGRSGRAPWMVREDTIIHFTEPITFGFFGSSPTGRSASEARRSALGLGRCLLFIGRFIV